MHKRKKCLQGPRDCFKSDTFLLGTDSLRQQLRRCAALGRTELVSHSENSFTVPNTDGEVHVLSGAHTHQGAQSITSTFSESSITNELKSTSLENSPLSLPSFFPTAPKPSPRKQAPEYKYALRGHSIEGMTAPGDWFGINLGIIHQDKYFFYIQMQCKTPKKHKNLENMLLNKSEVSWAWWCAIFNLSRRKWISIYLVYTVSFRPARTT